MAGITGDAVTPFRLAAAVNYISGGGDNVGIEQAQAGIAAAIDIISGDVVMAAVVNFDSACMVPLDAVSGQGYGGVFLISTVSGA